MSWWIWILLVLGLGICAILGTRLLVFVFQLQEALGRLRKHDFRPVILRHPLPFFRDIAVYVREISEHLQRLDQQVVDEGFSLRTILSSMVEGVMVVDQSRRIRLVNDAFYKMFDLKQSVIDRGLMEVFFNAELHLAVTADGQDDGYGMPEKHRSTPSLELYLSVTETLRDGLPRALQLEVRKVRGRHVETKFFEVYSAAVGSPTGSQPIGAVVVFHDVTKIKSLEAIRKEFVANVSHEFRTPLTIINGYLETLMDGALDDREITERSIGIMHKHSQRLGFLIDDLLTIARMEGRGVVLQLGRASLTLILERVIEQIQSSIDEKGVRVFMKFPKDLPDIEVDVHRIEQVCVNLLTNALRYGGTNEPEITITATKFPEYVELRFSDNGPGIPYEDQPHIFERFYRVHKDRSRDAGGTGLGLSIVKNVVVAHGGSVSLESVPGNGATFVIKLPFRRA